MWSSLRADERRVTNRSALKGDGLMAMEEGGEKVAWDMAEANLATPTVNRGAALR
jgi:hypothetical protein